MKRTIVLLILANLCQIAIFGQMKHEMVVENTDGTETVFSVENIKRTYFRVRNSDGSIVGRWEMTHVKGWHYEKDSNDQIVKCDIDMDVTPATKDDYYKHDISDYVQWEFNLENQFIQYSHIDNEWKQTGGTSYNLNGNTLTIGGLSNYMEITVLSLTEHELLMRWYLPNDTWPMDINVTMKRVE